MATPIIEVRNLSKLYSIGRKSPYGSLREEITEAFAAPFRRLSGGAGGRGDDHVWALKDVSFDVAEGEVLGIIGRNGAGKSTLLKILSRITEPTEGKVLMRGRVASLLEVGTGFHPELTGRENIFLNGALLGMTKREIKAKFDEIVAFSEIEKFLDTPVKRYSSGMYVRLAFAVAAHLEPEILIIDEVLAVGDAEFQKKCLGKMGEVAKGGRTVLFVSHNMAAVKTLCSSALLIADGRIMEKGSTESITATYLKFTAEHGAGNGEVHWPDRKTAPGGKEMRLASVRLLDEKDSVRGSFGIDELIRVEITYELFKAIRGMRVNLQVVNSEGVVAFTATDQAYRPEESGPGLYRSICTIPGGLLNFGIYYIKVFSGCPGVKTLVAGKEFLEVFIEKTSLPGGSIYHDMKWPGVVAPRLEWETRSV